MAKDVPSTSAHQPPLRPDHGERRPALVGVFPKPQALPLPDSGTVVGRAFFAEHGLCDSEISSAHIRFDRAGGGLRVADVGSRNGTWVNGIALSPRDDVSLEEGAVLRLGRTVLVAREALVGSFEPSPPLGELIGPFGLRPLEQAIAGLAHGRPRNVLIEGETGVGKELCARAVASALGRGAPFAAINVAGVAAGVFESQMFGHVAGAFSGAGTAAAGIIVSHDGGTLFLDEIGELSLDLQAKLLRLLENREVLPVGANRSVGVDVLVLGATNRDLAEMVDQGTFRRDLYSRLAMVRLQIPPLRQRGEDIVALASELRRRQDVPLGLEQVEVEAVERLLLEPWLGNVRQLDAALAAAYRIDPTPGLRLWALEEVLGPRAHPKPVLTHELVEQAVAAAGGNVTAAAQQLGVSRGKLLRFRKQGKL